MKIEYHFQYFLLLNHIIDVLKKSGHRNKLCFLISICFLNIQCNDDCFKKGNFIPGTDDYYELDQNSIYYHRNILSVLFVYFGESDLCIPRAAPKCLNAVSMKLINNIEANVEVRLNLVSLGVRTFFLNAMDTIDITPLPDYCKNKSWGEYIEVNYR
ncbi:MAG TPA: hypothetical protein PK006_05730 [Saprospiraceae bacterium]|nr:hypothetical protein [Saprospiraceae bacterium]